MFLLQKILISIVFSSFFGVIINQTINKEDVFEVFGTGECDCVVFHKCKKNNNVFDDVGFRTIDLRAKEGPCKGYFEICCNEEEPLRKSFPNTSVSNSPIEETTTEGISIKITPELTTKPSELSSIKKKCGMRNPLGVGFRVKGGINSETQFGEFPWMVAILRETLKETTEVSYVYQCGGSLIHPKVVLTAAHCVTARIYGKKFKVRAGEWDSQTDAEIFPHQETEVETFIAHERYSSGTLQNDIALLILKTPFEFTDIIDVVCLPPAKIEINSTKCIVTNWDKDIFEKEGVYQSILKKVEIPMVNRDECQEKLRTTRLGSRYRLHTSFACAGGIPGKGACKGDGGSPLVCPIPEQEEQYYQSGIVSWGIGCENQIPGIYANVAEFRPWIDEQMEKQGLNITSYQY